MTTLAATKHGTPSSGRQPKRARRTAEQPARGSSDLGSSAAHDVYKASEILERIYSYSDTPTLATCLLLERSNTATCARYLYETIPGDIVSKMSRTSVSGDLAIQS